MNTTQAKSSIKKAIKEAASIDPSSVIDFFEIDTTDIQFDLSLIETKAFTETQDKEPQDRIFRFHNSISLTTREIVFDGKTYVASPIAVEGMEATSRGTLPRPTLSLSVKPDGVKALSELKAILEKIGDLTGAKFTRTRTFAKFIDASNSVKLTSKIKNHDPDPNAILSHDIYFIDRKTGESQQTLSFEMASSIDLENFGVPKRLVIQDKCQWQYRGEGCCYTTNLTEDIHGVSNTSEEAETFKNNFKKSSAPPVATSADERIFGESPTNENGILTFSQGDEAKIKNQEWKSGESYSIGDQIYITKNGVEYHFVAKVAHTSANNNLPPNKNFWYSDQCSKSIKGCKLRFNGVLPFGGFPAVNKTQ
ncbi:MAG: phage minor tail protein L [Bacteroidetes bacterium]|nr:MAG: phage minor tail protein L [Bacteroidota bacterium]